MKIFNSIFEMKLRILLLLSQTKRALYKEEIVNMDFVTIYSADFGIGEENLHGDNTYKYGEFASRHELAWEALKQLVVEGLITVVTNGGFSYKISADGLKYANSLESAYSVQYRDTAREVYQKLYSKIRHILPLVAVVYCIPGNRLPCGGDYRATLERL